MNQLMFRAGICLVLLLFLAPPPILSAQSFTQSSVVIEGRKFFTGEKTFSNGGPSCISCHSVHDPDIVISGGTLALDISLFGALPKDALEERIIEIPFPHMVLMKGAFDKHPVTKEEADLVISYLKEVSQMEQTELAAFPTPLHFLVMGLLGLFIILNIILLYWHKRKAGTVHKKIFERQSQTALTK